MACRWLTSRRAAVCGVRLCLVVAALASGGLVGRAQMSGVVKKKLGPNVNGPKREATPRISPDGQTLYFTREGYPDDPEAARAEIMQENAQTLEKDLTLPLEEFKRMYGMTPEQMREGWRQGLDIAAAVRVRAAETTQKIFYSERQRDGSWGPAKRMPLPLNKAMESSAIYSVLPDNNTLLVAGRYFGQPGSGGILGALDEPGGNNIAALSRRSVKAWQDPEYLKIDDFRTSSARNDFQLDPSGQVLMMSLITPESVGDRDLYVSFKKPVGGWTRPKDLGPPVNTTAKEASPFVAPDGKTLYFASNRPGGIGGFDIYLTRRLDDTWLKWSPPQNLGPAINTLEDEVDLTVDASGRFAYLASGKLMQEDIYEFALAPEMRPRPVALVRGKVMDPDGKPVSASIGYERLRDAVGAGTANANPADGRYQIALPIGEDYGFHAGAAGYLAVSDHLDLLKAKEAQVVERDLILVPIKVGASIRLNNIFFKTNEAVLLPESKAELDRLTAILKKDYPQMEIEIGGHTDSVGDAASNQKLSEGRAAAVVTYLVGQSIQAGRLRSKGYGEARPVATNDTDEGRQLNRRVEFTILKR